MMIQRYLCLVFVLLFAVGYMNAQKQVCKLMVYYDIPAKGYNSSWDIVDKFELPPEETEITKDFHHAESGTDIHVSVDLWEKPNRIVCSVGQPRLRHSSSNSNSSARLRSTPVPASPEKSYQE